ncbi:hypothetical protein HRW14_00620 [Streptomyces lunaelactis]|uniref:hypothetical protein n=1 Tax=Streptomyces lunaelactis TaxID=1535768 RepID=UPI0015856EB6|nr:hypothetical protein [Streptomyces lunaelactis]NUK48834.1 hypothetical protein [Streptomyces lunaelactis]NUK64988.1 hypothetical protein [Streptomyces lunaelactis]
MGEQISADLPPMPETSPKAPKPSGRNAFLKGLTVGVLTSALVSTGLFLAMDDEEGSKSPAKAASGATATAVGVADKPTEEPMEEIYNKAPVREEFSLDLKTKSKQCFGSAGCNVTVEPNLSYLGPLPLDPDKTYSITYEVRGGEDGAIIQTMELTNQTSLSYHPVVMSTATSGAKLTAEVTDIAISG